MKYNIFIFSFLILIISSNSAISDNNYIINEDTVYTDNSKVYLSANPHTLSSSGWVYFNLTSKVYTGNIDACWGFNTSVSKPTKAEIYSPRWINTTTNHQKIFYNPTHVVYTGDNLDYGNSYNTNYKYTVTETINNDNGTTYITSNAAFDSYTIDGTNYTIYWHNRHDNYCLWEDFSPSFNSVIHNYNGYNKWYYIKNIPITSNKEYTVRAWIDVPVSTEKQFGKYYFAIKPSHETISQAITNGHFYNLDPWWNATWTHRKEITLTGNTSGAQTDYQLLLNVTYDSDMQSDFDDLRFCNETHELNAWLESKVDDSYALVWVKFPTTPANGVNQTYYMYYGNAGAASDWDGGATFLQYHGAASTTFLDALNVAPTNIVFESKARTTSDTHEFRIGVSNTEAVESDDCIVIVSYSPTNKRYTSSKKNNSATSVNEIPKFTTNTYYKLKIINTGSEVSGFVDDDQIGGDITTNIPTDNVGLSMWLSDGSGDQLWSFARKYAANPPTYTFGSEEYYIPPTPTTLINETKLIMSEITTGLKSINMGNYLVYTFILIGILLIILGIQIITNNIYRR